MQGNTELPLLLLLLLLLRTITCCRSRAQPAGDNILDILDSPAGDSRSVQSDGGNLKVINPL